jgi:hypothetical protein
MIAKVNYLGFEGRYIVASRTVLGKTRAWIIWLGMDRSFRIFKIANVKYFSYIAYGKDI